jgi:multidrug transporter EmrE-like cation transporter
VNSAYLYIAGTIVLGVCGQLLLKWQMNEAGELPGEGQVSYLVDVLLRPWVIVALATAVLAAVCWIIALSKIELSQAYPFISATFVLVLVASAVVLDEPLTFPKIAGGLLIVAGLIIGSQA